MKQSEKIVTIMAQKHRTSSKVWFVPSDFMKQDLGELFVGYEASARFSELARDYPHMFTSTKLGKFMSRKINWGTIDDWIDDIPVNLRNIVEKYR